MNKLSEYLAPGTFVDSHHPAVIAFARQAISTEHTDKDKAITLYYAVRDGIRYYPYDIDLDPDHIRASLVLAKGYGYCTEKSILLCALGRVHGIPSRLGFSIVKNHISTQKFLNTLKSGKFVFHGYNEFYLDGRWVKCTPAFNKELCERFNVEPLDWDGEHDSIFQQFDKSGQQYMEYLHDYGQYADLPFDYFVSELKKHYSHLFKDNSTTRPLD